MSRLDLRSNGWLRHFAHAARPARANTDGILVIHEGTIAGELSRAESTPEKIMRVATGGEWSLPARGANGTMQL